LSTVVKTVAGPPPTRSAHPLLWPVSGLAKAPLHLPARVMLFLAQWLPACAALRACIEAGSASLNMMRSLTVAGAAQVGVAAHEPLRRAPCFPFNCARSECAREHQIGCECRFVVVLRQSVTQRQRLWSVISYTCVWCPHARSRVQLNGKQEDGTFPSRPVLPPQRSTASGSIDPACRSTPLSAARGMGRRAA
jgi:hypothetical protein